MSDAAHDTPLIEPDLVALDVDLGETKEEVIAGLARIVGDTGRADAIGLRDSALEREALSPTGMPGGFAIPHCRSAAVKTGSLGFARLSKPVDFGAKDGPSDIVFLIAAAEGGGADHMKLLTKLARALVKKDFLAGLRAAQSRDEIVEMVGNVVSPPPKPAEPQAPAGDSGADAVGDSAAAGAADGDSQHSGGQRSIVAITACPTGIAHTYMAADYLVAAGKELGVTVHIEPQGSSATTPVDQATIDAADAAIFATDVGVKGRERFAGKPVVESGVKRAINEPEVMIKEALAVADDPDGRRVAAGSGAAASSSASSGAGGLSFGSKLKQVLLTGVSYMIPFVAAGGLLIALAFAVGGFQIIDVSKDTVLNHSLWNLPAAHEGYAPLLVYLGSVLHQVGAAAFTFLVPALAGYIAFGIADRPGIAPGFTAGAVAMLVGAGFIGGLLGGLVAGVVAYWIASFQVPRWLRGLMPVVIIPLFASLVAGGLMMIFGQPLKALTDGLQGWLGGMSGTSAILLGVILGLMMCFDLGGPVNKAAYAFAAAGLNQSDPATLKIMAAVMAAGMVPPIAMAMATVVRKKLFTEAERENGVAAWLLGASFISEGAIPFAAADPLRVIPSMMAGGAVTGALSMAVDATSRAPHGGVFVFFAIGNFVLWLAAILIGAVVACALVVVAKSMGANGGDKPTKVGAEAERQTAAAVSSGAH
ncbi:PTS system fructose-specific IIC component [Kineosphaera limosa]|uniref:Putative phosphotransferase system enzyme II n=1 Tax=Kineosphaera limosa NBRC 100340 TaxID=1184609 RepID=K6WZG8_9MICO|nr:fructose-specific PTS transporter subunit EIIC [Kineosphaera limosa]NYE00122.1 PTS system fructose-specific IIC component [Kineosphaera limosa]GAB97517.1 putative phosphotransferase system enzyme II [Kineosphaera limosa NBRC 100340]